MEKPEAHRHIDGWHFDCTLDCAFYQAAYNIEPLESHVVGIACEPLGHKLFAIVDRIVFDLRIRKRLMQKAEKPPVAARHIENAKRLAG